MNVSIVCAWKDMGDHARRISHAWTRDYWTWHFPEAELIEATPEPFTRAAGLNAAIKQATGDVILQADPDSIIPPETARLAVRLAAAHDGLVVPYDRYLYLTEFATRRLHETGDAWLDFWDTDVEDTGLGGAGPVTAFSRRTWELVGGYDERFGLWGGDDAAFAYACDALVGPERRIPGPVLHSWHPRLPESVPGSPGYVEGFVLLAEYRDAHAEGREAVRAMVEGGRREGAVTDGFTWAG